MRLDPNKTYIVGSIAPPGVLDVIKEKQPCVIDVERRWVHVGILFPDNALHPLPDWRYVDADFHAGVKEVSWGEEVARLVCSKQYKLELFEYKYINIKKLRSYVGTPFSKSKLVNMRLGIPVQDSDDGVTCGELIGLCSEGIMFFGNTFKRILQPCDFQVASSSGINSWYAGTIGEQGYEYTFQDHGR